MNHLTRRSLLQSATLAVLCPAGLGWAQVRDRSVLDDLPRMLDELDLPQMPERQSQLGFEVRTKEFVVIARTSMEDARQAAREMQQIWHRSGKLADHWTKVHRRPTFGIGSVQLLIDDEPVRKQDEPLVSLNVVGIQTQIAVNVGVGQPTLREQLPRIQEATAWAFLHTAELDVQFPAWVCYGLANFIANEGSPLSAQVAELMPKGESLGGQQWKGIRTAPGKLDFPENQRAQAALQVRYLLEGNDAELAPKFLAALRQSERGAEQYWAQERRDPTRQIDQKLKPYEGAVNELADKHSAGFQAWLKNPQMGQPKLEPAKDSNQSIVELQQRMATILKLARRFPGRSSSTGEVRVASFDREKGVVPREGASPMPRTMNQLYRDLTDPKQSEWATIGPDSRLLFSAETERIQQLLGIDRATFQSQLRDGHWTVGTQVSNRLSLQGWLEENKDDPTRPLAKFAMVDTATGQRRW